MRDIETREDIDALLRRFYDKAFDDELIGLFFTEVVRLDLDEHLPIIGDFWESLLFGKKDYQKRGRNPLQIHAEINQLKPLTAKHFRRWLEIFSATIDENFAGEMAEAAKMRAEAIGNRMQNYIGGVSELEFTQLKR